MNGDPLFDRTETREEHDEMEARLTAVERKVEVLDRKVEHLTEELASIKAMLLEMKAAIASLQEGQAKLQDGLVKIQMEGLVKLQIGQAELKAELATQLTQQTWNVLKMMSVVGGALVAATFYIARYVH